MVYACPKPENAICGHHMHLTVLHHSQTTVSEFLAKNAHEYIQGAFSQTSCKEAALKQAFNKLDSDLPPAEVSGSTAVVVLLDSGRIVCANCGEGNLEG